MSGLLLLLLLLTLAFVFAPVKMRGLLDYLWKFWRKSDVVSTNEVITSYVPDYI